MGWLRRLGQALLQPAPNPVQGALSAVEKQIRLLREVREVAGRLAAVKEQLHLQASRLRSSSAPPREIESLGSQIRDLEKEHQRLKVAERSLARQLESYQAHCDLLSTRRTAAEAQVRAGEVIGGVADIGTELHQALDQAQESTERMEARVSALRELMESGVLPDLPAAPASSEGEPA